jgi:integrase
MDHANTDKVGSKTRPLQKRLAKDRRSVNAPDGRVRSMTFRNYLERRWLPLVEMGLEPSTASHYRRIIRLYVAPELGDVRVGRLDRVTLQAFYARLLRQISPYTHRPLSKGTVAYVHCMIHGALEDLVQTGQLLSNPARGLRPRHVKSERYEYRIWTQDQVKEFLNVARSDRMFALWRLLAFTGMRRNEALALKCSDVRIEQRQLSVRRALGVADKDTYLTRPKTDAERVIELDKQTVRILGAHIKKRPKPHRSDDWVFSTAAGEWLSPTSVTKWFRRLVDKTDLPVIRLHDLRHTHASHLILAGANVKAVQERLGHSDVVVTLNIYSHVLPTTQRDAIRQLERFYSAS